MAKSGDKWLLWRCRSEKSTVARASYDIHVEKRRPYRCPPTDVQSFSLQTTSLHRVLTGVYFFDSSYESLNWSCDKLEDEETGFQGEGSKHHQHHLKKPSIPGAGGSIISSGRYPSCQRPVRIIGISCCGTQLSWQKPLSIISIRSLPFLPKASENQHASSAGSGYFKESLCSSELGSQMLGSLAPHPQNLPDLIPPAASRVRKHGGMNS